MSGDFMSIFQDLIPKVFPSRKFNINMGAILSNYGDMGI
jgi:hypothetical protein